MPLNKSDRIRNVVPELTGITRSEEEEKQLVEDYHKGRETKKKSDAAYFDSKTGLPKAQVQFEAPAEGERKPDANVKPPVPPAAPKTEEKK